MRLTPPRPPPAKAPTPPATWHSCAVGSLSFAATHYRPSDLLQESVPGMREAAGWRLSFPLSLLAEACALAGDPAGAAAASEQADEFAPRMRLLEGLVRRSGMERVR